LNNGLRIVAAKLARVNEMFAEESAKPAPELPAAVAVHQAKIAKLEEARGRLEAERDKYAAAITAILGRINAAEDASVEVTGEIAEGTIIEICQVALFVTEPLKKVRVRLDRSQGKIVTESL
jgi:septal ring factor EnvC (AmiA/AmiB activator)